MSLQALTAYLSLQPPGHTIDSAYQLHREYRLSEATVKVQLQSHGYTRVSTSHPLEPEIVRNQWVKQETQLDRIEKKLDRLLSFARSATLPRPSMTNEQLVAMAPEVQAWYYEQG